MSALPREPKLMVFDLDGTLVPTMHGFADIAAEVIAAHYGWERGRARQGYLDTSGIPFFQQLEVLFPKHRHNSKSADLFESQKETFFFSSKMPERNLQALRAMKEHGIILTVSSNNFERLVHQLIAREAPGIFAECCGFREGFAKGTDHFQWLKTVYAVPAQATVFVGDSLSDMKMAQRLGLPFIAVTGTFAAADFLALDPLVTTIASVAELPALFATTRAGVES